LEHYLPRWREVGYEAIETPPFSEPERPAFLRLIKENSLQWVPQISSRDITNGGSVRNHLNSLRQQIEECLDHQPLFFNVHSGYDNWSPPEAEDFYGQILDIEQSIGVTVAHETHRGRYFGIPWQTRLILKQFPELRLTCDLSHWVCVCERLLPDLEETIALAARHCHHIHARVGYEQGPQVPDPSAPEYATHLNAHERWWDVIWQSQRVRGFAESTLTPEFGPPPYLHTLPHTNVPVADLANICDWMAQRQKNRFKED